jgi:hypothetical protein
MDMAGVEKFSDQLRKTYKQSLDELVTIPEKGSGVNDMEISADFAAGLGAGAGDEEGGGSDEEGGDAGKKSGKKGEAGKTLTREEEYILSLQRRCVSASDQQVSLDCWRCSSSVTTAARRAFPSRTAALPLRPSRHQCLIYQSGYCSTLLEQLHQPRPALAFPAAAAPQRPARARWPCRLCGRRRSGGSTAFSGSLARRLSPAQRV